jgi:CheY-like chemotaxis protein
MQLKDATILIVDDEPDLRDILADWFKREAHRVLVAENGAQALEAIEANHIDVIVSDVRMPVMDGIALLKNIKAGAHYRSSVMFISGFTDIEPRESYDLGVEAVMSKPVERKELIAVVTRVLAERDELWRLPPGSKAENVLEVVFDSLDDALSQRLLAFGRGGFCILSTRQLSEGPISLLLDFQADRRRVEGHGVVRWTCQPEPEVGVEITYIHDENRAWVLSLTSPNESLSFIPRTTAVIPMATMVIKA